MFGSILIKLTMLLITMGVVLWIGWTVSQSGPVSPDQVARLDERGDNALQAATQSVASRTTPSTPVAASHPVTRPAEPPAVGTLDLNRATVHELEALPGIGPVLAMRIVEYRQLRGVFHDVGQLRNVKGIGRKTFDRIHMFIHVVPSNVSSREGRKIT